MSRIEISSGKVSGIQLSIGTLDGGSANSKGATISGSTIYLQSASSSEPGLVNTIAQDFVGQKTFTNGVVAGSLSISNIASGNVVATAGSGATYGIPFSTTSVADSIPVRDFYGNLFTQNYITGSTITVSTTTVTTLTVASTQFQITTGTQPQTYKLPDATTLENGWCFYFINNSTNVVTIEDNGGNFLTYVGYGGEVKITLSNATTSNGVWYNRALLATGVVSNNNTTIFPGYLQSNGLYMYGSLTVEAQGTATSSTNYSSYGFNLNSSYWNGSAAATDDWTFQNVIGAGTNPYSIFNIAHSGSPGLDTVYMPALDNTPIGQINQCPGSFTTLSASAGIQSNVATTTAASLDTSANGGYTIANGASAAFTSGTGTYFFALIAEVAATGSTSCWVLGDGYSGFLGLNAGGAWIASTSTPAAGHMSVAYSAGRYFIYNNYGSAIQCQVTLLRAF